MADETDSTEVGGQHVALFKMSSLAGSRLSQYFPRLASH